MTPTWVDSALLIAVAGAVASGITGWAQIRSRVAELEKDQTALEDRVKVLEGDLNAAKTRLKVLEDYRTTVSGQVSELFRLINDSTLTTEMARLEERLASVLRELEALNRNGARRG